MSFEWRIYFLIAQRLSMATGDKCEGWHRSAISRAYYAAFNKAEAEYVKHSGPAPGGLKHKHREVWRWFKSHTRPEYRKVGIAGLDLMDNRHIADYDNQFPRLSDAVIYSLKRAEQILSALGSQ